MGIFQVLQNNAAMVLKKSGGPDLTGQAYSKDLTRQIHSDLGARGLIKPPNFAEKVIDVAKKAAPVVAVGLVAGPVVGAATRVLRGGLGGTAGIITKRAEDAYEAGAKVISTVTPSRMNTPTVDAEISPAEREAERATSNARPDTNVDREGLARWGRSWRRTPEQLKMLNANREAQPEVEEALTRAAPTPMMLQTAEAEPEQVAAAAGADTAGWKKYLPLILAVVVIVVIFMATRKKS